MKVLPQSKKRKKYFDFEFDFMEFISIERYLGLLSGFEAFKFYYFTQANKFNFDCVQDLFIFSQNYNLKNKDKKFILNEESCKINFKNKKELKKLMKYINQL